MASPTQEAEQSFTAVIHEISRSKSSDGELNFHLRVALMTMAAGLRSLSVGVRATYMLLEEVQKELRLSRR
jgi:hypothetical protein